MLLNIIALCVVLVSILLVCAWVAGARTTGTTTTAPVRPAPAAKDQRPLWAQVPMVEVVPLRHDPWANEWARIEARFEREAQAGKDRPLPRFVPSPEPPPQRRFHRPLKAKGRNSA